VTENYDTDLRNRLGSILNMGTKATQFTGQIAQKQDEYNQQQAQQKQQQLQAAAQANWQKSQEAALKKQQDTYAAQMKQAQLSGANQAANTQGSTVNIPGAPKASYSGAKGNTFENFLHAISGRESGGNYSVVNRDSGALGKYQVMPGNVASWTKAATGKSYTPQQYLHSPQLQEATAQYMLKKYYDRYGPAGAAVSWYSGEGNAKKYLANPNAPQYTRKQGAYSSIGAYALGILSSMGLR
jgi:ATPase subunit of ABC transporter with duplicated ATPase domains